MMKKITFLCVLMISFLGFSQELLTDGDFESGSAAPNWTGNGAGANVIDDGSGSNFVNAAVVSAAVETWQTNLQQVVTLNQGQDYELSFDAYVDSGTATMIAGIAQNFAPFAGATTVNPAMTTTSQTFTYTITFEAETTANGRVFFDMDGTANNGKTIFIDNVSLTEVVDLCNDGILNNGELEIDCGGPNCGACPGADLTELIGNGGFETGDFTDWIFDPGEAPGKTITITTTNPSEGANAANINNTVMSSALGLKSVGRGIGIVNPGDEVTIKFDARGSFGVGGVLFAELFSEFGGGSGATNEILSGGPLALNPDPNVWTSFEFTTNLGGNVTGGISLLFLANPGASNEANVFIDNVSVVNNDQILSSNDFVKTSFKTYPNPTQNSWTIETSQGTRISSITVFDVLGKSVVSINPSSDRAVIDGSNLKSGLYFAKVETAEGISSVKLVKK